MAIPVLSKPPIDDAFALLELFFLRGADKYCAEFFSYNWEKMNDKCLGFSASERRLILVRLLLCESHILLERISSWIKRDGAVDSFVEELKTLPMPNRLSDAFILSRANVLDPVFQDFFPTRLRIIRSSGYATEVSNEISNLELRVRRCLDPLQSQGTPTSSGSNPEVGSCLSRGKSSKEWKNVKIEVPKTAELSDRESFQGVASSGYGEGHGSRVERLGTATGILLAFGVTTGSLYGWDTFNPTNNNHTQSLSSKILAYGIAGFSVIGVLFAFVGLSLWTIKPMRLPFGCNPEEAMLYLFSVASLGLANAYIAIMSHRHLRDAPFLMWTVIVLLCARITTVLISIR